MPLLLYHHMMSLLSLYSGNHQSDTIKQMKKAFKSRLYLETTGIIFFSSCFVFPLERKSFTSFLSLLIETNDTFLKKRIAIHNLIVRPTSSTKVDHSQYMSCFKSFVEKRVFSWTLPLFLSTTRNFPSPTRKKNP